VLLNCLRQVLVLLSLLIFYHIKVTCILWKAFVICSIHGSVVFSTTDTDVTNCRINYAFFAEMVTEDVESTRDVYR